jgi:hypothetical protein
MNYRITIDYENNAEKWWDGGGRELWEAFSGGKFRTEKITGVKEMMDFLIEVEKIPGWNTGPDHAKYPFCVFGAE